MAKPRARSAVVGARTFGEFAFCEVGETGRPVGLPHGWRRLFPMEAIAAGDPSLEGPSAKLLREPLFWAAAFVGVVGGLVATFSMVVWYGDSSSVSTGTPALALWGPWGDLLPALSLLGVPALLGRGLPRPLPPQDRHQGERAPRKQRPHQGERKESVSQGFVL